MAIKGNLVIDQGSDYLVTINVETANGTPVDLGGYTSEAQMRKHYTSSRFYEFDTEINLALGTITLSMDSNTTNTIAPGRYIYDCEVTSNTGIKTRLLEGIVTITPQVTR
jgi:hypothetical protein